MDKEIRDAATLDEHLKTVEQEVRRIGALSLEKRFLEAQKEATKYVRETPLELDYRILGFKVLQEEPLTFFERGLLARHLLLLGRRKAGRPAPSRMRDVLICMWVEILAEVYDISRTRNSLSPPDSACDCVAQALSDVGRPFAYDTVRKIYAQEAKESLPEIYQEFRKTDLKQLIGNKNQN